MRQKALVAQPSDRFILYRLPAYCTIALRRVSCMQDEAKVQLHPLWRQITALDGRTFYFNPFTGRVTRERFEAPPEVPGGILSDEVSCAGPANQTWGLCPSV